MPKSLQMNEISNSKVPSSSLLRLQKTASSLDSRFADHPHTQIVPPLKCSVCRVMPFWYMYAVALTCMCEPFLDAGIIYHYGSTRACRGLARTTKL